MPENKANFRLGHRHRLRDKFMETPRLVDSELLELALTFAIPRVDVKPIARALLNKFGSWHKILGAPVKGLIKIPGLGPAAAIYLKVMHESTLRGYVSQLKDAPVFQNHEVLENYCKVLLSSKDIEEFHALYLDRSSQLIEDELHAAGTIDHAAAYPREILKRALALNARKVVLLHNHPGGCRNFSKEDMGLTWDTYDMLKAAEIDLHDHMLVAGGIVFSAKVQNCFYRMPDVKL
ncbi:MAG: DNA repair protein RadC [Alphaproteobacteria bacterium]|nr:DNA repair protein RadC [Alphaproteobacteria bacterium]